MNKPKKVPLRKCLGCGEMKPKQELIRAVRSPEGEISLDLTGKKNGRGAYICRDSKCLTAAIKAKRFERAFGCKIEQPVYDSMLSELDSDEQN
ncbi:MAG: YlxR family protein [Clostridia bacterium]|nr:YlxR family protein [Clostridia bacterium]MBR4049503.1 YlxR family protein [Clostridia bacterium]